MATGGRQISAEEEIFMTIFILPMSIQTMSLHLDLVNNEIVMGKTMITSMALKERTNS